MFYCFVLGLLDRVAAALRNKRNVSTRKIFLPATRKKKIASSRTEERHTQRIFLEPFLCGDTQKVF